MIYSEAALKYTSKCIAMGPEFYKFDSWTGRYKFLYTIHEKREEFAQHWEERLQWLQQQEQDTVMQS